MTVKVTDLKSIAKDLLVGGPYKRRLACDLDHPTSREFALGGLYFMIWFTDQENLGRVKIVCLPADAAFPMQTRKRGYESRRHCMLVHLQRMGCPATFPLPPDMKSCPKGFDGLFPARNE